MKNPSQEKIEKLMAKGVVISNPGSVEIGDEVSVDRISGENVIIRSGSKIFGEKTLILSGVEIGREAPVTVENCYIGPNVKLKGGYYQAAVFLEDVSMGSGCHVREGCIFEEQSSAAHTVGMKQTILFPFVTLGSLINFCDCFMAGGTSRKDHSEVGSSYIHFNYTPNQDKATASLIGDVAGGVMLNRPPIFLGGQGGLVGPVRIAFGTVIAAGTIYRKDELREGRLLFGNALKPGNVSTTPGFYRAVKRVAYSNVVYMANLLALLEWYRHVRSIFVSEKFPEELFAGLVETLEISIAERIKRFRQFAEKLPESEVKYRKLMGSGVSESLLAQKREISTGIDKLEEIFNPNRQNDGDLSIRQDFLEVITNLKKRNGDDYVSVIQELSGEESSLGSSWLAGIVHRIMAETVHVIPSVMG